MHAVRSRRRAQAEQVLHSHAATLADLTAESKRTGARHHRAVASGSEIVIIDEWESEEGFRSFFENNERIGAIAMEAGATGPPSIEVLRPLAVPGEF